MKFMFQPWMYNRTYGREDGHQGPSSPGKSAGVTEFAMGLNITQSGGGSQGQHVHQNQSETMYVIEGKIRFSVGSEEYLCGPHDVIHAPAGVPPALRI